MKNYKDIKGAKALTDCKNNLKNDINLELLEKDIKEKLYKEEEAIIKNLLKEIQVLDTKIKEILI